jgi:ankyrin repeat protein
MEGDVDMVRCLLELGADVNQVEKDKHAPHSPTPLHFAVQLDGVEVLRLMINIGGDVNKADMEGDTPLIYAVRSDELEAVELLIEAGAGVNHESDVVTHDGAEMENIEGERSVHDAAREGYIDVLKVLCKAGADINAATRNGNTPLIIAGRGKHAAICKWLVKEGADPKYAHPKEGTAADISRKVSAKPEQIAYLEAKAHCAFPGCAFGGVKKNQGYMQARYCERACHLAHWPTHKAECRRVGAELRLAAEASDALDVENARVRFENIRL